MIRKLTPYFDALKEQGVTEIPTLGIPLILSITTLGRLYGLEQPYLKALNADILEALKIIDQTRLDRTRFSDNLIEPQLNLINQRMGSFIEQISSRSSLGKDISIIEKGIESELAKIAEDAVKQPRQTMHVPTPTPGLRPRL